jgi:hypothetical protein
VFGGDVGQVDGADQVVGQFEQTGQHVAKNTTPPIFILRRCAAGASRTIRLPALRACCQAVSMTRLSPA